MAHPGRADLLTARRLPERYAAIARVLVRVLLLNLLVAGAQIALGVATGAIALVSAGFHSVADAASNVVALVGISVARRPPDANHPYGHRKFETLASLGILIFLSLALVEVLSGAVTRLREGGTPEVPAGGFLVLAGTLAVNLFVVAYERREGARLGSELLRADARHTGADVLVTLTVIAALVGVSLGVPLLDPLAALAVAGFIGLACWQIAAEASGILSDEIALAPDVVRRVVMAVPGVVGCEKIRTRGSRDNVFLDLHLWVPGDRTLDDAHATSHVAKARLMEVFPQLVDVVIHAEPPPGRPPE